MVELDPHEVKLRPQQEAILRYPGGRLVVSAVPGSGKTLTLALLAARLIMDGRVGDDAEVLVVTMQNSAVDNISQRIRAILRRNKLLPVGFRVCTLHKLASDILRQRNDLAGVEDGFVVVNDADTERMMHTAANTWLATERDWWSSFLAEAEERQRSGAQDAWLRETERIGKEIAKLCKHLRLTPERAQQLLTETGGPADFARIGVDLYGHYARYLQARGGLDFDDLIWRAIEALEQDKTFLRNLGVRWPYILEDEAQDSSPLQEQILDKLASVTGNWIRVGDPNQSINSTFTSADPRYFRGFMRRSDVERRMLSLSGRSSRRIIGLANHLVHWACAQHPEPEVREIAFEQQDILPTSEGDEQQNPPDDDSHILIREEPFADVEAQALSVARWAASYAQRYPDRTIAVLCPAAWQGSAVVEALAAMEPPVPFDDLLKSTPATRKVARTLAAVLTYLGRLDSRANLTRLYRALVQQGHLGGIPERTQVRRQEALVGSFSPDDIMFPREALSLGDMLPESVSVDSADILLIDRCRELVARWVRATSLPVDQVMLTVAQDLFREEADLAICHSIATSLRGTAETHPTFRLADFASELQQVARNRRSLSGLSLADSGYRAQGGRVMITTMHKAKGLEWDAVYLMCVDSLEFPEGCDDAFRDELFCMPGRAPAVEARKYMERLAAMPFTASDAGSPVREARLEYICERLRLLYVGITRARRDLAVTWAEKNGRRTVRAAAALLELGQFVRSAGERGDQ